MSAVNNRPPTVEESTRADRARLLLGEGGPDSDAAAALHRLTDLVARLLRADAAQVTVVTDVQHVLASAGLLGERLGDGTPAESGICWLVVQDEAPVVIPDAQRDPRASASPSVLSGEIGSYIGVPLVEPGGAIVGALCAFSRDPRDWTEHDLDLLTELATPALSVLQLAALVTAYDDDRLVWQLAIDSAGVGAFDWNLETGELRWDERLLHLFGLTQATFGGTIEAFNDAVHPEDRDRVSAALTHAIDTNGEYDAEYRVILPNGGLRWVAARGRAVETNGTVTRLLGAAYDTTAVREGEARFARVLETMPAAYYQLDNHWRFTYVNAEAEHLLGRSRAQLLNQSVWELYPATVGGIFEDQYRQAVRTGRPAEFQAYYPPPLDGWYDVRAWPSLDGLSVYFFEVSERILGQARMRGLTEGAQLAGQVTDALTDTLDTEEALSRVAPLLVPALGDWCILTEMSEDYTSRSPLVDRYVSHADPDKKPLLDQLVEARQSMLHDDPHLTALLLARTPQVSTTTFNPVQTVRLFDNPAAELLNRLAPAHAAFVPLRARARTAGILSLYRDEDRGPFTDDELDLLDDLGGRIGLALDNARLYGLQRDLAIGLQRSLMTDPPRINHLEIATRYVPAADVAQVGGDWYDAFLQHDPMHPLPKSSSGTAPHEERPDGISTILVIGDVMGHDTQAAAVMGQVRSLLRGAALEGAKGPAALLTSVDRAIAALGLDTTATAVVGRLEQTPEERKAGLTRLRWSNAGHPPPVVITPDNDVELLEDALAVVMGVTYDAHRHDAVVTLKRGSTVLFYTDGLIERRGETIDDGLDRLRTTLHDLSSRGLALEDLVNSLLHQLVPDHPEDDVALLVVRLHAEDRPRAETIDESARG